MTEAVRRRLDHLSADAKGDNDQEKRRAVLARLVEDDDLSKEILTETRASLPLV
jgi:TetR/AcrR family transcriptional repressor of nem operon